MWEVQRCVLFLSFLSQVLCNNGPIFYGDIILIKPEDTPLNSTLGTLMARDNDGPQELQFSIPTGNVTEQYVKLDNIRGVSNSAEGRQADIILIKALDRDYTPSSSMKLIFVVEDNPGGEGNSIFQEITLYVTDVNDEDPVFVQNRYKQDVFETLVMKILGPSLDGDMTTVHNTRPSTGLMKHARVIQNTVDSKINSVVGFLVVTVEAKDPDNGLGGQVKYSMQPVGQAISEDYKNAFRIDPNSGDVTVNGKLDANIYNSYEYTLIATDGDGRRGQSTLLIKVQDIHDKPPYFTNLPYSVSIFENSTIETTTKWHYTTALDTTSTSSSTTSPTTASTTTAALTTASTTPSTTHSTTTSSYVTSSGSGGGGKSTICITLSCPTCPDGYHEYHEYANPCSYNCLCQLSKPTTLLPGTSNSLLLSILRNLQYNADALEQMAKGLSDEADLAQKLVVFLIQSNVSVSITKFSAYMNKLGLTYFLDQSKVTSESVVNETHYFGWRFSPRVNIQFVLWINCRYTGTVKVTAITPPKTAAPAIASTTVSTTTSSNVTSSGSGGGGKSDICITPKCTPCPDDYHEYHEYTNPCSHNCLCQLSIPTTALPGKSTGLLLSILRNLQNNADALEQMAKGLSDESDLAQRVAALP